MSESGYGAQLPEDAATEAAVGISRRLMIAGSGAAAMAAFIAACSPGDSGTTPGTGAVSGGAGATPDTTRPGEASTGTSGATSGTGAVVVAAADVPQGGAVLAKVDGKPVIVTQPENGTYAAFSAICTHMQCTVQADGGELRCPCHGSRFDLATGGVLGGPAPDPLPQIAVSVSGGNVVSQ